MLGLDVCMHGLAFLVYPLMSCSEELDRYHLLFLFTSSIRIRLQDAITHFPNLSRDTNSASKVYNRSFLSHFIFSGL
jgi:hypothetical protein